MSNDDLVRPPSLWPRLAIAVVVVAVAAWIVVSIVSAVLHVVIVLAVVAVLGLLAWRLVAGPGSRRR